MMQRLHDLELKLMKTNLQELTALKARGKHIQKKSYKIQSWKLFVLGAKGGPNV